MEPAISRTYRQFQAILSQRLCCLPERAGNSSGKTVGYMGTRKIGHDAETGQFISVEEAGDRKSTAVVESMKTNSK